MATLECDDVIYHRSYFVFDPENVQSSQVIRLVNTNLSTVATVLNADGDYVTLLTPEITALADPIFWSALVIGLTIVLLVATLFVQCCVCCWSHGSKRERSSVACRVTCSLFSCLPLLIVIACSAVILWSEFMMDAGVLSYESSLLSFIDATVPAPEAAMGVQQLMLQLFFPLQLYRHWISIALCIATILLMLLTLPAIFCCTPLAKSTAAIVVFLILNSLWTVIISVITAVTFFSLFLLSTICYDLYNIGGTTRCSDTSLLDDALSLQSFCSTDVFIPHLVTVCVYFGLLAFLVCWQLLGAFYAASFSGSRLDDFDEEDFDNEVQAEEMEVVTTTTTTTTQYVRPVSPTGPVAPTQPAFFVPLPNNFQPVYKPATNSLQRTFHVSRTVAETAPTSLPEESTEQAAVNDTDVVASAPPAPPEYETTWTAQQTGL